MNYVNHSNIVKDTPVTLIGKKKRVPPRGRGRPTDAQIIKVYEALRDVVEKSADGYAVYKGDFNDAKLATKLGTSERRIAGLRKTLFGELKRTNSAKLVNYADLVSQVRTLEARLASLETALGVTRV